MAIGFHSLGARGLWELLVADTAFGPENLRCGNTAMLKELVWSYTDERNDPQELEALLLLGISP
jgi:hypothetical protein